MTSTSHRCGDVECWISNICCYFLHAGAVGKIKTNFQISTSPIRCRLGSAEVISGEYIHNGFHSFDESMRAFNKDLPVGTLEANFFKCVNDSAPNWFRMPGNKSVICLFSPCPVTANVLAAREACTLGLLKWITVPSSLIMFTSSMPGMLLTCNYNDNVSIFPLERRHYDSFPVFKLSSDAILKELRNSSQVFAVYFDL